MKIRVALGAVALIAGSGPAFAQESFDTRVVIAEGDHLPGPARFLSAPFESLRVGANGTVVFSAVLQNGALAVVTDRDGVLDVLAQTAQPAPGTGAFFKTFPTIKYAADGTILFRADLFGGDLVDCNDNGFFENDHGLWRDAGNGVELVLREDDPLPGAPPFRAALVGSASASSFGRSFGTFVSTRTGECPDFVENNSIYMLSAGGDLGPLVVPGEPAPLPGTVFGTTANGTRFHPDRPGTVSFFAELAGPGLFEGNDMALVVDRGGQRFIRLRESDEVPCRPPRAGGR